MFAAVLLVPCAYALAAISPASAADVMLSGVTNYIRVCKSKGEMWGVARCVLRVARCASLRVAAVTMISYRTTLSVALAAVAWAALASRVNADRDTMQVSANGDAAKANQLEGEECGDGNTCAAGLECAFLCVIGNGHMVACVMRETTPMLTPWFPHTASIASLTG